MIKPTNENVHRKEQRKYFDKLTNLESHDEMFLMIVSGMAPIDRVQYYEKIAPKLDKFKPAKVGKEEDESNSTISHPLRRQDTAGSYMTDGSNDFISDERRSSISSFKSDSNMTAHMESNSR